MTTLDQVRPHQKQWRKKGSTPTRGASLPSFVLCFTVLTRIYAQGGGHESGQKRIESSQSNALLDTILLHHPTQFETARYLFLYTEFSDSRLLDFYDIHGRESLGL